LQVQSSRKKENPAEGQRVEQAIANYLQHMPTSSSYLDFQVWNVRSSGWTTSQRLGKSVANANSSEKSKFNGWPKILAKIALIAKNLPLYGYFWMSDHAFRALNPKLG
jgi:hypothetical protein